MTEWKDIKHFTEDEFKCSHCGKCEIDLDFVKELDEVREKFGKPMVVSSGYRCPEHPIEKAKEGGPGPHSTGRAADIVVAGEEARDLCRLGQRFPGLGINQTGDWDKRFIHFDQLGYRLWTY